MAAKLPLIYTKYGHHNWHGPIWFPLFIVLYKDWPTSGGPVITQYRIRHDSPSRNTPLWSLFSLFRLSTQAQIPQTPNTAVLIPLQGWLNVAQVVLESVPPIISGSNALMSSTGSEFLSVNTGAYIRWMGGGILSHQSAPCCCEDRVLSDSDCDQ